MKSFSILISLGLLAAAAVLIMSDRDDSLASEKQENPAQDHATPEGESKSSQNSKRPPSPDRLSKIDWSKLSNELKNRSTNFGSFKPSPELEKKLKQLSLDELLNGLGIIRTVGLESREHWNVSRYLHTLIVQRDPEGFCREEFYHPVSSQTRLYWERFAIAEWTRLSPDEALAWFETEAKQKRAPKQITRLENNYFSSLLVVDFEKAKARFLSTPEDRRHTLMQNFDGFGSYWTADDFQQHNIAGRFAELARLQGEKQSENIIASVIGGRGEQDRPAAISRIQESLVDWKKGKGTHLPATTIADYLDKIDATPQEQELCIEANVYQYKYYNRDGDLDAFRDKFTAEVEEIRSKN